MKKSRKLAAKKERRIAEYHSKRSDPRISETWKRSSNMPGSCGRKN